MKAWLFNPYLLKGEGADVQILSVFLSDSTIDGNQLESDLVGELARLGPIRAVHFVGFPDAMKTLKGLLVSPASVLMDRLSSVVGHMRDGLLFISLDAATGQHCCEDSLGRNPNATSVIEDERQYSLLEMFSRAGGEERAPTGTHYAKTSDRHSDRFLRVANVLEDGRHVKLLAFWLVPHLWKKDVRHVAVDTSGIYSVALTALMEAGKLGGVSGRPTVWSHRSHEGIDQVPKEIAREAMFLVSATTSNGLVRRVSGRGAAPGRVVTLFCLSADPWDGHIVLCNLNGRHGDGLQLIENQESGNCRWCKNNFHLIGIRGDQFSVSPPRVTSIEIVAADLPPSAKSTLSALMGLRVFYAYRRIDDSRLCSLGVNVAPLLDGEPPEKSKAFVDSIRAKWSSMQRRSQTVSLRTIVATAYPGSAHLADGIANTVRERVADHSQLQVVSASRLRDVAPAPSTSTLVVAACVDEVQELLSVSRNLRDVQEGGATAYLAVIQLLAPKKVAERLRSNLTYGALGADTFSSYSSLDLEVHCYEDAPSWKEEVAALRRMIAWADARGFDVPVEVEQRVRQLTKATATGLVDDLYWPDMNGKALTLRSDFALLSGTLQPPRASQADLFAAMCTLLTALRGHKDGNKRLAHNAYERSVLAPSNFSRFNDGVLQASILRACRSKDLAYGACDEQTSQQMLGILMDALPNASRPEKSEALIEFLLAMLTQRMTLLDGHLRVFVASAVGSTEATWPVAWLLVRFIQDELRVA
jgi:hypothetical protein